jgi:hypothetical protein
VAVVRHRRVPFEQSGLAADRHDVRVERRFEEAIPENAEAAIDQAAAGDEPCRQVAPVAPDLPSRARINRPAGVERAGHVDDAV